MALDSHIAKHLDTVSNLTYTVSGAVATITSATVPAQRLAELERVASQVGHEVVVTGGVVSIQPRTLVAVGVFTVTIAAPGVFTKVAHGLVAGNAVQLTTTGALPTGLVAGTVYWVIAAGLTADAFELSLTPGGAAINTTGSQSGTHSAWRA